MRSKPRRRKPWTMSAGSRSATTGRRSAAAMAPPKGTTVATSEQKPARACESPKQSENGHVGFDTCLAKSPDDVGGHRHLATSQMVSAGCPGRSSPAGLSQRPASSATATPPGGRALWRRRPDPHAGRRVREPALRLGDRNARAKPKPGGDRADGGHDPLANMPTRTSGFLSSGAPAPSARIMRSMDHVGR